MVLLPVVISNGLRAARNVLHALVQSPIRPTTTISCISSLHLSIMCCSTPTLDYSRNTIDRQQRAFPMVGLIEYRMANTYIVITIGFKVHTRGGTLAGSHEQWSSSGTERIACIGAKSNPPHNHRQLHQFIACIFIYSTKWTYSVKTMNDKNMKKNHRFVRMRTRT